MTCTMPDEAAREAGQPGDVRRQPARPGSRWTPWVAAFLAAQLALPLLLQALGLEPLRAWDKVLGRMALLGYAAAVAATLSALLSLRSAAIGPTTAVAIFAFLCYGLHCALFGAHLADDAAISWTFARNLAMGHGLVLNPGEAPVEGYSNPLWVALLALIHLLRIPIEAGTKGLGVLTGGLTLWLCWRVAREQLRLASWLSTSVLVLGAGCSGFVLWSVAGMETPLFALLLAALVYVGGDELDRGRRPYGSAIIATGLALTRPEGLGYVAGLAGLRWLIALRLGTRAHGVLWLCVVAALYGVFLLGRVLYFGDLLANTYYAKMHRPLGALELVNVRLIPGARYIARWLMESGTGLLAAFVGAALGRVLASRRTPAAVGLALGCLGAAAAFALLTGGDFYPGARFLAPVAPLMILLAAYGVSELLETGSREGGRRARSLQLRIAVGSVATLFVGINLLSARDYLVTPGVALGRIRDRGLHFAALAERAGIPDASLLDPDIGGTSYYSGLTIVDLGGLADREVARAMAGHRYGSDFMREYVFERRKPTFIHTQEPWTGTSELDSVEALSRDYLPIAPVTYSPRIGLPENAPLPSEQDFVRIDALTSSVPLGAPAVARAGAVEVVAASPGAGHVTVHWRLARPLPAGSRPQFVTHADGRPRAHPLLYGWVAAEALPVATVFRQKLPLDGKPIAGLAVVDGERTATVPLSP